MTNPRPHHEYELTPGATEYLSNFDVVIHLNCAWPKNKEVYQWCEDNLGVKFKDWFMISTSQNWRTGKSTLHIKNSKKATFFRLKWMEYIDMLA